MIGVPGLVRQLISANDLRRAAGKQGADDRMIVRVIVAHDFCERALEEIADGNALANVQIAESIHVHSFGFPQILPRAFRELLPGLCLDA